MNKITEKSNIRIIWRDKSENFSRERLKAITKQVKHKYKTNLVSVAFEATNKLNIGLTNLDTEDVQNINRPETQEKIILQYLKDNNIDITVADIKRLNKKVETELEGFSEAKDNRYRIKNLVIENFLAFGDKIVVNFDELTGITLINGDNFAGKTSLIIDSILFLLFNKTSKTSTAEEVINRFRDKDFAKVSGELIIDNVEYLIEREVVRKWVKEKSKTTTNLNFYKKDSAGEYKLENGEQRNATDKIIRENIGNEKEFLMTILCTGKNLFNIIEAKPTERGQVLSKFLGLEIFERKEEISKEMLKNWKVNSIVGKYSSVALQNTINETNEEIKNCNLQLAHLNSGLADILQTKEKLNKDKEEYQSFYYNDIDTNMSNLTEDFYQKRIEAVTSQIAEKTSELATIKGTYIENMEQFDVTKHQVIMTKINSQKAELLGVENRIKVVEREKIKIENDIRDIEGENKTINRELDRLRTLIHELKNGKNCPSCGQALKDVDHSEEIKRYMAEGIKEKALVDANVLKIGELQLEILVKNNYIKEIEEETPLINEKITASEAEQSEILKEKETIMLNDMVGLKIDKVEVEIESLFAKKEKEEGNLHKYQQDLFKIEKNKELDEKLRLKSIEITEYENFERSKRQRITTIESSIQFLENTVRESEMLSTTIKKEEHIAKVFDTYITMVGKNGISKTILKNTVPVLNVELSKLLMDTANFTVSIEINEKNNEVEFWMIDNKTDIKAPLSSGSGYETTVGALALRIVLSQVNTLPKPSMLLIDEIFGTVTNNNLELIKIFIDKVALSIDNIFMITHNEFVKEWASKIITVTKHDNVSTVKM